jgi:arylsulfatase A-like enzyme
MPRRTGGMDVFIRRFGRLLLTGLAMGWIALEASAAAPGSPKDARRPNILLIVSDDQGYGDLGYHENPRIKTPTLDRFARESVRLKTFCVSPVCSPTRASLMTGRYNYRTGVVDTYIGRSLMHPDETTLAEVLAAAGYRTGIFGKWHLGDNAPLRAVDQGFERALVIKGGGIGQASDPPGGSNYLDPILQDNGQQRKMSGYCSDVYTSAAIEFVSASDYRPFFAYLAFNCPHSPLLQPPEAELAAYQSVDVSPSAFPQLGHPVPPALMMPSDDIRRVYAMVTNIDTNVGRILGALASKGLAEDTIVIFMTDNGPAKPRFNAGLRGYKGTVYEGGIRVPFYIRWPGHFPAGLVVDRLAAHIDVFPTLLEACQVEVPRNLKLDGRSLMPLLRDGKYALWPDRTLYFQWHRGDVPELGRAFTARSQRYKLVRPEAPEGANTLPKLQLFDLQSDPGEEHDIAAANHRLVEQMHAGYLAWFRDVSSTRGFDPARIDIGGPREDPTVLTRQDWRGPRAGWEPNDLGYWEVNVVRGGRFAVGLRLTPRRFPTVAHVALHGVERSLQVDKEASECTFNDIPWTEGAGRLEVWVEGNRNTAGALEVTVHRTGDAP